MKILSERELRALTGLSRTTHWRYERDPNINFPKRLRLGPGRCGWDEAEVLAWLESRPRGMAAGRVKRGA